MGLDYLYPFIFAVILISSPRLQTLPVGIMSLSDEMRTEYGLMLATAVLAMIPSLLCSDTSSVS